MFSVGDLAVYPAHGVGIIEKIESQEISGCRQDFYVMRILDNDMIIMIPKQNVDNVGLREISLKVKGTGNYISGRSYAKKKNYGY